MLAMVHSRYLVDTRTEAVQKQFSRGVLLERCFENLAKVTGKHSCWSLYSNKVAGLGTGVNFLQIPVNFAKFLRIAFSTKHFNWLLSAVFLSCALENSSSQQEKFRKFYRNTPDTESFFSYIADLKAWNYTEERLCGRYFHVKFVKFSGIAA